MESLSVEVGSSEPKSRDFLAKIQSHSSKSSKTRLAKTTTLLLKLQKKGIMARQPKG